ncbi:uncharacterized protein LOC129279949 [Lytechinus pictus]|uniref:uncharacterized protein LOC129279949 n=1 Tax=Lytechinus pictus TaxID=7653 RepID=UPI0030B9C544
MFKMSSSKFFVLSMISGTLSALLATHAGTKSILSCLFGFLAALVFCISLMFLWILTLRPSPRQGILSVLRQLYFAGTSYIRGKYHLRELNAAWKNPRLAQEQFLLRILKDNGDTDYGKKFQLQKIQSVKEFRKRHPLTTYEDYKPYVERVMAGERGVMTQVIPNAFIQTSGTTGPSKYFPQRDHRLTLRRWLDVTFANLHEVCPKIGLLQRKIFHYVQPVMSRAESGGSIRTGISFYEDGFMASCYTTPPAGFRIQSFKEANYIHLLFGLLNPNVGVFCAVFLGAIDNLMQQLEQWWEDIVQDIEHGTINEKVQINDTAIRTSLEVALGRGHPVRAGELRYQFKKGFNSIMKRVWPNLEVLVAVDNAGVWPKLKKTYANGVKLVTFAYGTSEGMHQGLSPWIHDDNHGIAFWITSSFFEFIKLENSHESQPKTFLIDELEIGQAYEIVFTQDCGLYRYRVGDVIRITGYHYNCPIFEFMYRLGLILNLRYEKMNQVILKEGLQSAVGQFTGVRLVEYAVAESKLIPKSSPASEETEDMPYYVIFLELGHVGNSSGHGDNKMTKVNEITTAIDNALRERNSDYQRLRREGAISHPRVYIVDTGTFEELKQYVVNTTSTTVNQYKVPRRIRTVNILNFMYGHATSSPTKEK